VRKRYTIAEAPARNVQTISRDRIVPGGWAALGRCLLPNRPGPDPTRWSTIAANIGNPTCGWCIGCRR